MIIDIHRHFIAREWFSDNFWNGYSRMIQQVMASMGIKSSLESIQKDIFPMMYDTDGEKHLEKMENAGIDKTVLFLFDTGLLIGEPEVSIEKQNKTVFETAKKYPDRIIPFAHIDPRRQSAIEFIRKCVEEWGAKGIKLHPSAGFNPEESETLNLIEAIAGYNIPIITHTGPSIPPTSSRYCDPIYLDKILLEFPEVNIIAAHMAYGYKQQLFSFGWQRPNLYTDISVSQDMARNNYDKFARTIREAMDAFGADRVLFGTDSPFTWGILPEDEKGFVGAVRDLTDKAPEDIKFTQNEIDRLLGENAIKLLGL